MADLILGLGNPDPLAEGWFFWWPERYVAQEEFIAISARCSYVPIAQPLEYIHYIHTLIAGISYRTPLHHGVWLVRTMYLTEPAIKTRRALSGARDFSHLNENDWTLFLHLFLSLVAQRWSSKTLEVTTPYSNDLDDLDGSLGSEGFISAKY